MYWKFLHRRRSAFFNRFPLEKFLLRRKGKTLKDLDKYAVKPGTPLMLDFFLDSDGAPQLKAKM